MRIFNAYGPKGLRQGQHVVSENDSSRWGSIPRLALPIQSRDGKENMSSKLAREVEETFRQFLYLPNEHAYTVSTLWTLHTHLRDVEGRFLPYITPRLCYLSKAAGAGKTTALEITTHLSHNGELVIEPTPPSVVTLIDSCRATLGFDEIDLYFGRGSTKSSMRAILNGGYKRGTFVTKRRNDETVRENIHAPIAMAGKSANNFLTLERFETLKTRSHAILMEPKPADAETDYFDEERHLPTLKNLADLLKKWGLQYGAAICSSDPSIPSAIHNRNREIWKVLYQVAQNLGEEWPRRCDDAARAFVLGEHDETYTSFETPAEEMFRWVRAVFSPEEKALPSIEIVGRLMSLPGPHWWQREWVNASEQYVTRRLAAQLGIFLIEHKKIRVGEETRWGYTREDLEIPLTELDSV